MKIKLLVGRSDANGSSPSAGDEIEVSDREAYALISTNRAKPKVKKEYTELLQRLEVAEQEATAQESKLLAVQKEKELKDEAYALLEDLRAIVSTIVIIDSAFVDEITLKYHDLFVSLKEKEEEE